MVRAYKALIAGLIVAIAFLPVGSYAQTAEPMKKEEIEQLVAPITLYPDALVAQILMASTYPLEIVQAARWSKANPGFKGKVLEEAMQKQPWEASVKSLAAFPQVLAMMNDKLDMTQKLGDAFLAQRKDVMDAVQRLRAKARAAGNLKSGKEQTVVTVQEGGTTVIKIEPADPQVVYVPTYNPVVVYGAWPYPAYPPYYYYPPGYVAGSAVFSFALGVAVGNAMWGGCNWGRGDVNINISHYNSFNKTSISNTSWNHNANNRKGVPYRDAATRDKFGKGSSRVVDTRDRDQFRGRADPGRNDLARDRAPAQRDAGPGDRGVSRAGPSQQPAAFDGIGNGAEARSFGSRGASSRASAAEGSRGGRSGRRDRS